VKNIERFQAISQLLNVTEEEAKKAAGSYVFKVTSVTRIEPVQINQELFDQVFGKDVLTTEKLSSIKSRKLSQVTTIVKLSIYLITKFSITMLITPKSICRKFLEDLVKGDRPRPGNR